MIKSYTIATSGNCEKIYIWKVTSFTSPKHMVGRNQVTIEKILTLRGHNSAVTCVRYNHNGSMLVSCSLDKLVKIWNAEGSCISTLPGHSRYVNCVSSSKDSNLLCSGKGYYSASYIFTRILCIGANIKMEKWIVGNIFLGKTIY